MWRISGREQRIRPQIMVSRQWIISTYHTKEEGHDRCRKMRDQFHSGKRPEDEVRAKKLCKHESTRWTNGETYRSPVRASSYEKHFEHITDRFKGRHDEGHSG